MTDCGLVMLFPSHVCYKNKVMFRLKIMLIYDKPH